MIGAAFCNQPQGQNPLKVVLLGKEGQVGFELQRALSPYAHIHAFGRADLDVGDLDALRRVVLDHKPDIVINATGWTHVDLAEQALEPAWRINAEAVAVLAQLSKQCGFWLIHYSTDYVFDGQKTTPYLETDVPHPLSVYGQSKLAGEQAIQSIASHYVIMRTSWVYANRGSNFPRAILNKATTQDRLEVNTQGCGAPTSASLLADLTALLVYHIARGWWHPVDAGLYHVSAQGQTSWFDYAVYLVEQAHAHGIPLTLQAHQIIPVVHEPDPSRAPRPDYSCLNTDKFMQRFHLTLPHWSVHLHYWLGLYFAKF